MHCIGGKSGCNGSGQTDEILIKGRSGAVAKNFIVNLHGGNHACLTVS